MAVTYATEVKTARMTATRDHFQNGTLRLLTAADAVLATFTLTATAGTVSGAVWTLAVTAGTVSASGTGVAAKAEVRTSGGVSRITGLTVGTSGTDVVIDNASINSGQQVTLSSATFTHA